MRESNNNQTHFLQGENLAIWFSEQHADFPADNNKKGR